MKQPFHWPVLDHEDMYRADFEAMHAGRNLKRHHLRGTYSSPTMAALWNQHVRSVQLMLDKEKANG